MEFLFLVLVGVIGFGGLLFSFHKWKLSAIYCFAIGGAVNANFFHIGAYPIVIGNFIFGIDSVIYTLFVFCVILTAYKHGTKDAMKLTYSSIGAIGFAAIMQFIADWINAGTINTDITWSLVSFLSSMIATWLAIIIALKVFEILKQKNTNQYLTLTVVMLLASIIDSVIYFGVVALWNGGFDANFGWVLLSSYIGKFLAIGFSLLTFFILNVLDKKKITKNCENSASQQI